MEHFAIQAETAWSIRIIFDYLAWENTHAGEGLHAITAAPLRVHLVRYGMGASLIPDGGQPPHQDYLSGPWRNPSGISSSAEPAEHSGTAATRLCILS